MLTVGSLIKNKKESVSDHYKILWENEEIEDEKVYAYSFRDNEVYVHLYESIIPIEKLSTNCIADNICKLELHYFHDVNGEVNSIEFALEGHYKENGVRYVIYFDFETWNFPWSIQDYANELLEYGNKNQNIDLSIVQEDYDFVSNGFHFYRSNIPSGSFDGFVNQDLSKINDILKGARENLIIKSRPHALVTWFEFPESIKNSCEQYLIYFGEFLKDIGINANSEMSEIGNKVLFSVVPDSKKEAIEKVRLALNIFLQLPSYDYSNQIGSVYSETNIQRLQAQILHLQSQLLLSNCVSNTDIRQTNPDNAKSGILLDAVEYSVVEGKKEDKEELLGGLISITKYKGKGFEIDLPGIIRKLKGNDS